MLPLYVHCQIFISIMKMSHSNATLISAQYLILGFILTCFTGRTQIIFTSSNASWPVPAGCTEVLIEAWGGGGGGGSARVQNNSTDRTAVGGGGKGGMYANDVVPVTPGEILNIIVGGAGAGGNNSGGGNGGNSSVTRVSNSAVLVRASGGHGGRWATSGGMQTTSGDGTRNLYSNVTTTGEGIGSIIHHSGHGGMGFRVTSGTHNNQRIYAGAGGGAGGGTNNAVAGERIVATLPGGNDKQAAYSGGNGGAASGIWGNGGNGGDGAYIAGGSSSANTTANGSPGSIPGGGGGGGAVKRSSTSGSATGLGGAGARGEVRIHCYDPLSVTLTDFYANCVDNSIEVYWRTVSEHNSSHFVLERSRDGLLWEATEKVAGAGAGTTLQINHYSVLDKYAYGNTYYRLKQANYDGQEKFYGPIQVDCSSENNGLAVYPNPNNGSFIVAINTAEAIGEATVFVQDMSGKVIASRDVNVLSGTHTVHFENTNIAQGTYFVSITGKDKDTFIPVKLVIQ